jgi:hypothetical protein
MAGGCQVESQSKELSTGPRSVDFLPAFPRVEEVGGGGDRRPVGRVETENALSISFLSPLFATILFKCANNPFPPK